MIRIFLSSLLVLVFLTGRGQNHESFNELDQEIKLSISTPQPRLNENFTLALDIEHVRANIFKSLVGKIQISSETSLYDNSELSLNVTAIKKGLNEIGPLEFTLDNIKYKTNKITYEVVDELPKIDRGVWVRTVRIDENVVCIIIEQRIPAKSKMNKKKDNSVSYTTEPESSEILKFKDTYSIAGLNGLNSEVSTNFSSVIINGEPKQFMYGFSVYYFKIVDKNANIKITKDVFQNIPDDYDFKTLEIQ